MDYKGTFRFSSMKIENYKEAREYLESFVKPVVFERITPRQARLQDPLLRMRHLLFLLGNPQNNFHSVLVGGTAGKGSTAYLISHILTIAGYKVGLTISPHLQKINERMQINGKQISDQKLIELVNSIVQTTELMRKSSFGEPSYFEILVAMAFLYFAKSKVDIAIVEVGLGGKYDATNTLNPLISVLTNVSLDHTEILGKTVEKIAKEKVGIIKRIWGPVRSFPPASAPSEVFLRNNSVRAVGSPSTSTTPQSVVITGVKQPSVIKIVEEKCKQAEVKVYRLGKDFDYKIKKEEIKKSVFDFYAGHKKYSSLKLSMVGLYQLENASAAIETILKLRKFGFGVDKEDLYRALKTAFFPGRFEVVKLSADATVVNALSVGDSSSLASELVRSPSDSNIHLSRSSKSPPSLEQTSPTTPHNYTLDAKRYTLILDGAHNPTKMQAFIKTLQKLYPSQKKIFVIAFKKGKNIKEMLKEILKAADTIVITKFSATADTSKNAANDVEAINYQLLNINTGDIDIYLERNSQKALRKAFEIARSKKDSIIVITGSLYLVGEVRDWLLL